MIVGVGLVMIAIVLTVFEIVMCLVKIASLLEESEDGCDGKDEGDESNA